MGTPTADELSQTVSPATFAQYVSKGAWSIAPHLALLDRALTDAVANRGPKRLVVTMPPRHGKSQLCSRYLPAWFLGTFPDRRVLLSSYEADFATRWGRQARAILAESGPSLFGVSIANDSSAANRWDIAGHAGGMETAGVGGALTGKGADLLIVDDPVKNAEEANSETYREKAWDWWQSTARTRLEPGGVAVVVQTRWHEDDLAGRLLAGHDSEHADKWHLINLPAIAEGSDAIGRQRGDALWPARWNLKSLLNLKASMREYWWSALYQQRPTPAEGGMFKRVNFVKIHGLATGVRWSNVVRYWDKAATADGGDYSAGVLMSERGGEFTVVDVVRGQWSAGQREQIIKATCIKDRQRFGGVVETWIEQEPGSGGKESAENTIRMLAGFIVRAERVTGDKITRADPFASQVETRNVNIVDSPQWTEDFLNEAVMFPNGAHDDQIDAASGAFAKCAAKLLHGSTPQAGTIQTQARAGVVPVASPSALGSMRFKK